MKADINANKPAWINGSQREIPSIIHLHRDIIRTNLRIRTCEYEISSNCVHCGTVVQMGQKVTTIFYI